MKQAMKLESIKEVRAAVDHNHGAAGKLDPDRARSHSRRRLSGRSIFRPHDRN